MDDAREAKPFGAIVGTNVTEANLYHLAPLVCLKFRGRRLKGKEKDRVVKGALANYIANEERGLETAPEMAFALCYVSAHYVLDLIDEDEAQEVLAYCEERLA